MQARSCATTDRARFFDAEVLLHEVPRYYLGTQNRTLTMTNWQPIETAPRDGTRIDVAVFVHDSEQWTKGPATTRYRRQTDAYFSEGHWVFEDNGRQGEFARNLEDAGWWGEKIVKFWMPAPKLPDINGESQMRPEETK